MTIQAHQSGEFQLRPPLQSCRGERTQNVRHQMPQIHLDLESCTQLSPEIYCIIAVLPATTHSNRIALAVSNPDAAKFPNFLIAMEDLKEIMSKDHAGTVRPTRAAEILGLNIRTIRGLLDQKFLKPKQVTELQAGRKRRYVCAKSMERFRKRYISVVELSNQTGRLPGAEAVIRLDQGLKPLPLGPRCRIIFRRDDVL